MTTPGGTLECFAVGRCRRLHPRRICRNPSQLMRHFLSQQAVSLLAHRVQPPPSEAPLVAPPSFALPRAAGPSRTSPTAIPRSGHVTRRAQRDRPAASRVPTDDDMQCDHGPRRREARHPRGPVRPKMGRTATSRSAGAIEDPELPSPCPRYVRRAPTVADPPFGHPTGHPRGTRGTAVMTFTAIADHVVAVGGDLHRDPW